MFFAPSNSRLRAKIPYIDIPKTFDHMQIKIKMPNPFQEPPASYKAQSEDLEDMVILCTFKIKIESQIWNIGVPKASNLIQTRIKMLNPSQEHPTSYKAPNKDYNDMDVLCTFKIKIESHNSKQGCIKDQWPCLIQDQDTNPSKEPQANSKAQNQDLKDMDVLCPFKIKMKSQNLKHLCIKYQ